MIIIKKVKLLNIANFHVLMGGISVSGRRYISSETKYDKILNDLLKFAYDYRKV